MPLKEYLTLGRSGLRVSSLCLGTMTFGTEWGWGADESASAAIFDRYIEAGGNYIDTADGYTNGKSEEICGKLIRERGLRDGVVLATKFTFNTQPGNPNSGGNGRKNAFRALEGSLRRLGTDYIDLYWMHAWNQTTPVEELMATFDLMVRSGKVRYVCWLLRCTGLVCRTRVYHCAVRALCTRYCAPTRIFTRGTRH